MTHKSASVDLAQKTDWQALELCGRLVLQLAEAADEDFDAVLATRPR